MAPAVVSAMVNENPLNPQRNNFSELPIVHFVPLSLMPWRSSAASLDPQSAFQDRA